MKETITTNTNRPKLLEKLSNSIKEDLFFFNRGCLFCPDSLISIEELSKTIDIPAANIVSFFWKQTKKINKNQNLSKELLKQYCDSISIKIFRHEKNFNSIIDEFLEEELNKNKNTLQWKKQTPVVAIMGHIDHGKTTLVDTICKSNLREKEIGEITQKITILSLTEKKYCF